MRFGLPISIALHLAILVWATISIGSAKPPVVLEPVPVQVDMLTTAQFADLRKGSETSKVKTTAAKPKDAEPADAPPVKAKRKADVAPPPKAEPEPPKPEPPKPEPPKPEPPKPDPIAEQLAKPEPKKPEPPKPDPIAEQLAKPAPKKPDLPKTDPIAEPLKKVAALDPPKAPKKAPPKKKGFDISKLQAQINQLPDAAPDAGSDATPDQVAKTTAPAIGVKKPTGTQLSATEQQMFGNIFNNKVRDCWSVLAGAADARDLVVSVSFDLNPDGRLKADAVVTGGSGNGSPQFTLAAENVVRAIRQCEPYALPPELYAKWSHWDYDFDPRAMFGG